MVRRWLSRTAKRRLYRSILLKRDGPICQICGGAFTPDDPPTLDHVVERKNGGSNRLDNYRLAHRKCNDHRSNKPGALTERFGWYQTRGAVS
jgi:5-methylcytosine-specific restriction endonuclease McrA